MSKTPQFSDTPVNRKYCKYRCNHVYLWDPIPYFHIFSTHQIELLMTSLNFLKCSPSPRENVSNLFRRLKLKRKHFLANKTKKTLWGSGSITEMLDGIIFSDTYMPQFSKLQTNLILNLLMLNTRENDTLSQTLLFWLFCLKCKSNYIVPEIPF